MPSRLGIQYVNFGYGKVPPSDIPSATKGKEYGNDELRVSKLTLEIQ